MPCAEGGHRKNPDEDPGVPQMKERKVVSVIIPCYKQGRYLAEAIQSCLDQDYTEKEIIVVNDGSPDNTREVARSFGDRIVYIEQENRGLSAARNAGIRAAAGDYVALLDSDDVLLPGSLAVRAAFLDDHEDITLVCSDVVLFDEGGDMGLKSAFSGKPKKAANLRWETVGYYISANSAMVRRRAFDKAGLFDEGLRGGAEDWLMWVKMSRFFNMAYLDRPLTRYRIHGESATSDSNRINLANRSAVRSIVDTPELRGYPRHFRSRLLYYRFATSWRVEPKEKALAYLFRAFATSPFEMSFGLGVIRRGIARTMARRRPEPGLHPGRHATEAETTSAPLRGGREFPRVSIIIPCFNQGLFLRQAIQSVLDQGYPDTEIIVVNDGSTDNTREAARCFGDRIVYIEQENGGVSVARNTAVARATGPYLAFLDSDDTMLANSLPWRVAVLNARSEIGLVCGDALTMDQRGGLILKSKGSRSPRRKNGFRWETVEFCATTSTVMVRKECMERAGPFETVLRQGQDWYQWVKLSPVCEMAYLDTPLAFYRLHETNVTRVTERVNKYNRIAAGMAVEAPFFAQCPRRFRARLLYYRFATAWYDGPKGRALSFFAAALKADPRELPFGLRIVFQGLGNAVRRLRKTYP
jgi:glycosyltransferase involved in cell wall biosynthesis